MTTCTLPDGRVCEWPPPWSAFTDEQREHVLHNLRRLGKLLWKLRQDGKDLSDGEEYAAVPVAAGAGSPVPGEDGDWG